MKNITVSTSAHPRQKDITLVSVKGFIDTNTAPEFDRAFQGVLGSQKFNLVVDLKDVTYISSVGWGIFIGELKRIRSQNGNLVLASMNTEVGEAYKLLEFDSIIKAFPDVEQAVTKGFTKLPAKKGTEKSKGSPVLVATPTPTQSSPQPIQGALRMPEPQRVQEHRRVGFFEWLVKPWKWF